MKLLLLLTVVLALAALTIVTATATFAETAEAIIPQAAQIATVSQDAGNLSQDAGNLRASPSITSGTFADNTMTALATTKQAQEVVLILKTPTMTITGFEAQLDTTAAFRTDLLEAQIASPATTNGLS